MERITRATAKAKTKTTNTRRPRTVDERNVTNDAMGKCRIRMGSGNAWEQCWLAHVLSSGSTKFQMSGGLRASADERCATSTETPGRTGVRKRDVQDDFRLVSNRNI